MTKDKRNGLKIREGRYEWVMMAGYRIEPSLKKRFEAWMVNNSFASMADALRFLMKQVVEDIKSPQIVRLEKRIEKIEEKFA